MAYGLKEMALDALKGKLEVAPEELSTGRYKICKACPSLLGTGRCELCGCKMSIKVKLTKATCPAKKW